MSKKVSFKEIDGVEVLWLDNEYKVVNKESFNVEKYGSSRPKNNLEKAFNKILLYKLCRCWTIFPLEHWNYNPVGNRKKFENTLNKFPNLTKKTFVSELMKVLKVLSLGRSFVLNYRNSIKLAPIVKYKNKYINLVPIIKLWYIRIFQDETFSAIRIQTIIRKKLVFLKINRTNASNKIITWWKNKKVSRWWCMLDKKDLLERKNKRAQWMERYIETVPEYNNKITIRMKNVSKIIINQYTTLKKLKEQLEEKTKELNTIEEALLELEDKNWELLTENTLLRNRFENKTIDIPSEYFQKSVHKLSPPVNTQIVKVRANELISKLNDKGITTCILAKDNTVRVSNNIVVVCSGKSQIYTLLTVENGLQDNWKNEFVHLSKTSSADQTIQLITKKLQTI